MGLVLMKRDKVKWLLSKKRNIAIVGIGQGK